MNKPTRPEESPADPRREYLDRKRPREEEAGRLESRHHTLGYARLATAAVAVILAWIILQERTIPGGVFLIPLAVFVFLSWMHDRVLAREERLNRSAAYWQRGIDRIDGNWAGTGETGAEFSDLTHPFAEDLDLFGDGSLYQLLCSARTHAGQELLAGWLMASAAPAEIRANGPQPGAHRATGSSPPCFQCKGQLGGPKEQWGDGSEDLVPAGVQQLHQAVEAGDVP